MAQDPIRLYWWNKVANFGDAISPLLVAHVSGRPVVWAGAGEAELFALGSIMRAVARGHAEDRGFAVHVWGAGALKGVGRGFLRHVKVAALRGPRTAEFLGLEKMTYGDPGLLIAQALGEDIPRGDAIGIIPHHGLADDPAYAEVAAEVPGGVVIDVRAEDPRDVVRQIAGCAHVFSSSLHGLITADAYGVGNTWMSAGNPHGAPDGKYYDYAEAIGRDIGTPVALRDVPNLARTLANPGPLSYAAGIETAQANLASAFPQALRAN